MLDEAVAEVIKRLVSNKKFADKMSGDNIYKALIFFDKLYEKMSETENRAFYEKLIKEVQIPVVLLLRATGYFLSNRFVNSFNYIIILKMMQLTLTMSIMSVANDVKLWYILVTSTQCVVIFLIAANFCPTGCFSSKTRLVWMQTLLCNINYRGN